MAERRGVLVREARVLPLEGKGHHDEDPVGVFRPTPREPMRRREDRVALVRGGRSVVLRASLERERRAKLVANEDVREPEDAIERLEDPSADSLRHGRTDVSYQHGEGREAELATEHGRRLEHPLRRFRQAPHVRTDGLANAERELARGEPIPGRPPVDRREELRNEERIALRHRQQPIDARYEVGCRGFEPGGQGLTPQATDWERDRFAPDPGDQLPHLLLRV